MSDLASSNFLLSFYHATQITRYCQLAAGSIIIFDHMITFDDEVGSSQRSLCTPESLKDL
ncbi:hypothetical protein GALMADRAFT_1161836 [Galerina marginata CBS 339.88]|uniref:Uncharacterized protein n=1 Tax=Galerina marginata (strain CBS 339.88) TaxID=685588 RepID=A0A067SEV1_GALM3|nr:hypothetical protein GALMADRAFT_1161836 [Galerina marginata CBS 339.88]